MEDLEPGEIPQHLENLLDELDTDESKNIRRHLVNIWNHPEKYENDGLPNKDLWEEEPLIAFVEMGIIFGIEYELTYPTGKEEDWPISIEDRY